MSSSDTDSIFNISVFTPKPGLVDRFVAAQRDGLPRFGDFPGLNGGRLYRAEDGARVILVSGFDSVGAHRAFMATPDFAAHRQRLLPFVESAEGGYYRLVYARDPRS